MPAGRPPVPTALKLLHGNPGKRPINKREPMPEATATMPERLQGNDEAVKEWTRLAPMLARMRVLTEADVDLLANLCFDLALLNDCQKKLLASGLLVRNKVTGLIHRNPLFEMVNQLTARVAMALRELGMTPASRSRIQVSETEADSDPWQALKREVGGSA